MRERWFSREQKEDHAAETGWQCEMNREEYERCPATYRLEAHHMVQFSDGGETVDENMLLVCKVDHVIAHEIAGEIDSANLIRNRLNQSELDELRRRGY